MKTKTWKLWLFSSVCFIFCGIMYLIDRKFLLGSIFILTGIVYIYLCISNYKKDNKPNKIEVPDEILKSMNIELRSLIEEGKKYQAIKKCRSITGFGLKEANEYVDLLIEENKIG